MRQHASTRYENPEPAVSKKGLADGLVSDGPVDRSNSRRWLQLACLAKSSYPVNAHQIGHLGC